LTYNNGNVILYLDGVASSTLSTGFGELQHIPMFNILDIQMVVLLVLLLPIIMVD
jgi:hypothetical protein